MVTKDNDTLGYAYLLELARAVRCYSVHSMGFFVSGLRLRIGYPSRSCVIGKTGYQTPWRKPICIYVTFNQTACLIDGIYRKEN